MKIFVPLVGFGVPGKIHFVENAVVLAVRSTSIPLCILSTERIMLSNPFEALLFMIWYLESDGLFIRIWRKIICLWVNRPSAPEHGTLSTEFMSSYV